jgi:hypothetical protein
VQFGIEINQITWVFQWFGSSGPECEGETGSDATRRGCGALLAMDRLQYLAYGQEHVAANFQAGLLAVGGELGVAFPDLLAQAFLFLAFAIYLLLRFLGPCL